MILLLSHSSETGLVKKSLHPAASAAPLSDCNDDAVKATMMTEERVGLLHAGIVRNIRRCALTFRLQDFPAMYSASLTGGCLWLRRCRP